MEETLTDCLVRVREDLSQLTKVRDYLETNAETQERCTVTWQTIEAFNSILTVCSSQNSPETPALDILLDSFFYLAKNNTENTVWDDFGFELGIICVKVLSAIERTNIFEILFSKLLSIIEIICEFNGNIWKATARQILNVLINKKISYTNLETIVKIYISILKRIDNDTLCEFSTQNFHLLKTLYFLVQKIGDFEIQSGITQIIYIHLSKNTKLLSDIFEEGCFDFENDIRLFLNILNKSRKGCDRKVYSISCHVMYLGGCFVEPPSGENFIWVDANKDTERLTTKYYDCESDNMINIPFSNLVDVQFDNAKTEGNLCLTIKTKNEEDVCLVTENTEEVYDFVRFLQTEIRGGKRNKKISKTTESLVIVRNNIVKSQELSPKSFVESLDKHIGLTSPELQQIYEDSIETIDFMQKTTPGRSHKLFKNSDTDFCFDENKENIPVKIKTYTRKSKTVVETNSEEYFRGSSISNKKPFLPKLKRSRKIRTAEKQKDAEVKPSLLDPNGYAYQRWCKPTTSERSNFWLRKLDTLQKPKTDSAYVFDFSDESDSIFGKRKKKRVVHSKRKCRTKKETKQTSLREVKAILKKVSPVKEKEIRDPPPESEYESVAEEEPKIEEAKSIPKKVHRLGKVLRKDKQQSPVREKETREPTPDIDLPNEEQEQPNTEEQPTASHTLEKVEEKDRHLNKVIKTKKMTSQRKIKTVLTSPMKQKQTREPTPETDLPNEDQEQPNTEEQPTALKLPHILEKVEEKDRHPHKVIKTKNMTSRRKIKTVLTSPMKQKQTREPTPDIDLPNEEQEQPNTEEQPTASHILEKVEEKDRHSHKVIKTKKMTSRRKVKTVLTSPMKQKQTREPTPELQSPPPEEEEEQPEALKLPHILEKVEEKYRHPHKVMTSQRNIKTIQTSPIKQKQTREPTPELQSPPPEEEEEPPKALKPLPKNVISCIKHRLAKTEAKDKHYTDEIIRTVDKAMNHIFNHLQKKDGENFISYLKTAEEVSTGFQTELEDLNLRTKRIQRAILYFKAGCSVDDFCEFLNCNFSKVRKGLKSLKEGKSSRKTVERVCDRLSSLIGTEVEKSFKAEWILKKERLLKCASILGTFEPDV